MLFHCIEQSIHIGQTFSQNTSNPPCVLTFITCAMKYITPYLLVLHEPRHIGLLKDNLTPKTFKATREDRIISNFHSIPRFPPNLSRYVIRPPIPSWNVTRPLTTTSNSLVHAFLIVVELLTFYICHTSLPYSYVGYILHHIRIFNVVCSNQWTAQIDTAFIIKKKLALLYRRYSY